MVNAEKLFFKINLHDFCLEAEWNVDQTYNLLEYRLKILVRKCFPTKKKTKTKRIKTWLFLKLRI